MKSHALNLEQFRERLDRIIQEVVIPLAPEVDQHSRWPAETMRALRREGLTGLHVPTELGGMGQGMLSLVLAAETLGKECPSTAICFGMHCVGTAVLAAKATDYQKEKYLRPIAAGQHITTLALSEPGTGSHFYLPETELTPQGDSFLVRGRKHFVTNGNKADSYVISTQSRDPASRGEFSCLVVDHGTPGVQWSGEWKGFGMRGNHSITMDLKDARLPKENLLGEEGEQMWYIFEVVAPYFLMCMAATYLGAAQGALDVTIGHLKTRQYSHTGEPLANIEILQHRLGELWIKLEKSRRLLYHAAELGDLGDPQALIPILAAKADVSDTAVTVANEAMTLGGGLAYRENSKVARLLRDIRASHVMAPTTDILKVWTGRTLLGLPLL